MFFEDTSFDSLLNHEKQLEKGRVFDVVNRVINDDQAKKSQRPNFENPFSRLTKSSNAMNPSSPLFQTTSNYLNDNGRTEGQPVEKPLRERSPLDDRASSFAQNSPFMDNPEKPLKSSLTYPNSLGGFLNSPSSISSPNPANFSNFFTFHQLHQQNLPSYFPEHYQPSNLNAFHQFNQFNQSQFSENAFHLSNPKHRSTALTSKQQPTTNLSTKANLPARIWHERPKPSIHTLHPELWTIIFENLNIRDKGRVARTCTFFRDVVYSKSVWKGEVARLHLKKRNSLLLESLTRRGIKSVQILSLEHHLKELSKYTPQLQELVLTGCFNLSDKEILSGLTSKLPNLRELSLSMCKQITDHAIIHISEHLTSLIKLDVSGCPNITDQSLIALIRGLRKLKSLNLRSCRNITHKGLAYICGYRPEGVANSDDDQMDIDSDQELAIALDMEQPKVDLNSALVNLEELVLQDCQKLNDDVLRYVPLGLSQLKSINLSFCVGITEFGLKNLANHPSLESINLCHCNNVGDVGLRYLSEANLSRLVSLDVSFCDKVNDQALCYIAQGLKELQALSLNSCSITDNGLVKIGQNLVKLSTLNVGQCNQITDKSLAVVIENCVNLQAIDLYGCKMITTASVEKLSKLPKLGKINMDLKSAEHEKSRTDEQSVGENLDRQMSDPRLPFDQFNSNAFGQPIDKTLDENNNLVNSLQSNLSYAQNWLNDPYQFYKREAEAFSLRAQQNALNGLYMPFLSLGNLTSPLLFFQPPPNGPANSQMNNQQVQQSLLNPYTFYFKY